jgi:2-polyprenyl-3-methyl-5-hydroxy-6-metoxy-1,4-benzoquinol methylase
MARLQGGPSKPMIDSDKQWIRFGEFDPYLKTVQTLDPYKLDPTLPPAAESYFVSGERYLDEVFGDIDRSVAPGFRPTHAVDFGCSVGRIAIALARRCELMTGIDIAPQSLIEAERNTQKFQIRNARWILSDDTLSRLDGPVDLFHSYNVLQHIAVDRGMRIIERALELLTPQGVIAVHVPYADRGSAVRRAINWAQATIGGVHQLANVVRRRPMSYPHMLMNPYDLAEIFGLLARYGCDQVHCRLVDQRRYPGAIVMARKQTGRPER